MYPAVCQGSHETTCNSFSINKAEKIPRTANRKVNDSFARKVPAGSGTVHGARPCDKESVE